MYAGNFVICDQEQQYARNLLQMFIRNANTGFQMYLFHTLEDVKKFAEEKTIHILLIDEAYPMDRRRKIEAEKRFVLVRGEQGMLGDNERGICRYQSAEKIWMQIQGKGWREQNGKQKLKEARGGVQKGNRQKEKKPKGEEPEEKESEEKEPASLRYNKTGIEKSESETVKRTGKKAGEERSKGEIIGIYSPVHRIGKTRFAIELGKEMAKKGPVLYLNLEEYAGGNYYFRDQSGQTLADVLYYARQENGNLGLRISMAVGQAEELDYILPVPCIQDLKGVSGKEWVELLEQIQSQCIYTKIILDLGDSVDGLFQILEKCHTIYTPYIEEGPAHAKMNQYAENLRKTGREGILEKTIQKKMGQTENKNGYSACR